jgi:putative PD-(D/E)XK family protein DUF4420
MNANPWAGIEVPTGAGNLRANRVDATLPWNFFWARAVDGSCLLVLRHETGPIGRDRLPNLRGIDVFDTDDETGNDRTLAFKLIDTEHSDLFHDLCQDVVSRAQKADTETEAVELTLARMWRWHHLLRGGSDGRLSPEEQKGLMGELILLRDCLLPHMPGKEAVSAWCGPLGAPKDFVLGRTAVEVKARRGTAKPLVSISTPEQLDTSELDALFLYVVHLDRAHSDEDDAFTLSDVAEELQKLILYRFPVVLELYENLVASAGLSWDDDYSDMRWIRGSERIFKVNEDFPRLVPTSIPSGISHVRYAVALAECARYETDQSELIEAIKGAKGGD